MSIQIIKERPILFSAPMVRALLDGRKTQTRRPYKVRKHPDAGCEIAASELVREAQHVIDRICPYGQPGDRLWVRESFWGCDMPGYGDTPCVVYDDEWHGKEYQPAEARPWARKFGRIPSIHMPRDCSRILLEVTGVRVERLQDISYEDAEQEGVKCYPLSPKSFVEHYRNLWEQINGAGTWDANPFVWVIEFRRIEEENHD